MSTKSNTKSKARVIGRFHSVAGAYKAGIRFSDYREAQISEKLGPHFKPLLWVGSKAYVKLTDIEIEERKRAAALRSDGHMLGQGPNLQNIPKDDPQFSRAFVQDVTQALPQGVIVQKGHAVGPSVVHEFAYSNVLPPPPAEVNVPLEVFDGVYPSEIQKCGCSPSDACDVCQGEGHAVVHTET